MRTSLPGIFITLASLFGLMIGTTGASAAQTDEVHMLELPIIVAVCERDPGNKIQPGGGRFSPEQVMEQYGCDPAEDVSVTVSNLDIDFFARCETDDNGRCEVNAPTDPDRELDVALHMSTVPPGMAPKDVVNPTVHFTEFTGIGIPLFVTDTEGTPDAAAERTTIAVNIAECEDDSDREGCEREPIDALAQASTGEITAEGQPWLATNDEGWVSWDRALLGDGDIDLMLRTETQPRFACSDLDSVDRLEIKWIEGREGNFIRLTPTSDGDITCDVTLLGD